MKFLTIRQPYASLIAVGAKTIETRPFGTAYRGPLAIHAGKARPTFHNLGPFTDVTGEPIAEGYDLAWLDTRNWPADGAYDREAALVPLPLGAVVAVCDLVDVVPIVGWIPAHPGENAYVVTRSDLVPGTDGAASLWRHEHDGLGYAWRARGDLSDQLPFGDFTPGRHAWLLDNVRTIDPVPMKGAQGLRDVPDEIAGLLAETEGDR